LIDAITSPPLRRMGQSRNDDCERAADPVGALEESARKAELRG